MALSPVLIEKLHLHLNGQETLEQRLEFWQLLEENEEFAQAYTALRLKEDAYAPGQFTAQFAQQFEELAAEDAVFLSQGAEELAAVSPVTNPPVQPPPPVSPRPNWLTELGGQISDWWDTVTTGLLQPAYKPQDFRLAYVLPVVLVVALGIGGRWYWLDEQGKERLAFVGDQFGNPGHTAGSEASACDPALENAFYVYTSATSADTINSRIERLNQLDTIPESCRDYYLGRAHIWKRDYKEAERLLKNALKSTEPINTGSGNV